MQDTTGLRPDTGLEAPREAILRAARRTLAADPGASVAAIAAEGGVSRATFYRYFASRASLLEALDIDPDPDARERILAAAVELIERDGLSRLSMDELAGAAGVSRASVYRIFPGKPALFGALLQTNSPFDEITATLHRQHDLPPEAVLPDLLRTAARVVEPRVGTLRALMFEVAAGTPEALEAARWVVRPMLGEVSAYLAGQMDVGRIRRMHPILAAQAFMGPLIFYLVSRTVAGSLAGLDVEPGDAAAEFAGVALRGLRP
jgi:AcrR family transcriptional regulator